MMETGILKKKEKYMRAFRGARASLAWRLSFGRGSLVEPAWGTWNLCR